MPKFLWTAVAVVACLAGPLWATPISSEYVLGPTAPGKWGSSVLGTGATVTWSLMPTGTSCSGECVGSITALADFLPAGFLSVVEGSFAAWSAVANLTFIQVADDGAAFNAATTSGDIRLGGHFMDGPNGVLAHGYYPPSNGDSAAGDIHLDTSDTWRLGFVDPGFDLFQVLTHELGHALGLDHSLVANSLMNASYTENFWGPQADDIAGMQALYGGPISVPEPGTWTMLTAGLVLVGWGRRRAA